MSQESSEQSAQPSEEDGLIGIGDDRLPEDLRPGDDNPLAQPVDDDVPDDLLTQDVGPASSGGDSEGAAPTGDGGAAVAPPPQAPSETSPGDEPDESAG